MNTNQSVSGQGISNFPASGSNYNNKFPNNFASPAVSSIGQQNMFLGSLGNSPSLVNSTSQSPHFLNQFDRGDGYHRKK
jgi:hypothetical protein